MSDIRLASGRPGAMASGKRNGHMKTIEITPEEEQVLLEVLEHHLSEMDVEVFRTDTHSYKEMLKRRRSALQEIMAKLSPVPVGA
jgi:hypothetical protein